MAALYLWILKEGFGITSKDSAHIDKHLSQSRSCQLAPSAVAAVFNAFLVSVHVPALPAWVKEICQRQSSPLRSVTSLVSLQV